MFREKVEREEHIVDWEKIEKQLEDKLSLAEEEMKGPAAADESGHSIPFQEEEFIRWALDRVDELRAGIKTKKELEDLVNGAIQKGVEKGESVGVDEKKEMDYWIRLREELELEA